MPEALSPIEKRQFQIRDSNYKYCSGSNNVKGALDKSVCLLN